MFEVGSLLMDTPVLPLWADNFTVTRVNTNKKLRDYLIMVTQTEIIQVPLSRVVCFNQIFDVLTSCNDAEIISMNSTTFTYRVLWRLLVVDDEGGKGDDTEGEIFLLSISLKDIDLENTSVALKAGSDFIVAANSMGNVIKYLVDEIIKKAEQLKQGNELIYPESEVRKSKKREWETTKNYICGKVNLGKNRRLLYLQEQLSTNTPSYIVDAISALKMGDNATAYELMKSSYIYRNSHEILTKKDQLELPLLVLCEVLEQPEAIYRHLLAVKAINPNNIFARNRVDYFNSLADTTEKQREIETIKSDLTNDLDNAVLHYYLAIKTLSTIPLFMTINYEDSYYWSGLATGDMKQVISYSSPKIVFGKEELYLALVLGIQDEDLSKKALSLIHDIRDLEKGLSKDESPQPRNVDYIKSVLEYRVKSILEQAGELRNRIADDPSNAQLHFELAQALYVAYPMYDIREDIQYQFIYDYFSEILEDAKREYFLTISLGLSSPLDEARARLHLAKLSYPDNIMASLLDEAITFAKKHLRRYPHHLEALSILRDAHLLLNNESELRTIEIEIKKAQSLINAGILIDGKAINIDNIEQPGKFAGIALEEQVQKLLQALGLRASMTKASGDGGIDVIAFSENPIFSGKYIVQCKDWANPVGEPVVRDLYGVVMAEGANKGILITTGRYTDAAERFAEGKQIELIDGDELQKLMRQHNL